MDKILKNLSFNLQIFQDFALDCDILFVTCLFIGFRKI